MRFDISIILPMILNREQMEDSTAANLTLWSEVSLCSQCQMCRLTHYSNEHKQHLQIEEDLLPSSSKPLYYHPIILHCRRERGDSRHTPLNTRLIC